MIRTNQKLYAHTDTPFSTPSSPLNKQPECPCKRPPRPDPRPQPRVRLRNRALETISTTAYTDTRHPSLPPDPSPSRYALPPP